MKIKALLILFSINATILAQNDIQARKEIEIFLLTENFNSEIFSHIFYRFVSIQDFVWAYDKYNKNYYITSDSKYTDVTLPLNAPGVNYENTITQSDTFPNNKNWQGFDFVVGSPEHEPDQPDFAYGLYKLTAYGILSQTFDIVELPGTIYLDYRDSYYPTLHIPNSYTSNDIFLKYDLSVYAFYTSRFEAPSNFDDLDELLVENSVNRIWELAELSKPNNELFPTSFWKNCLISFEKNNHPYLIWSAYPDESQNISSYKIYRGLPNPLKPRIFNFTPIATVNNDVFEYVDNDILLNPNGDEVRYYITAVVNGSESVPSNTVSTNGGLYKESPPPPAA